MSSQQDQDTHNAMSMDQNEIQISNILHTNAQKIHQFISLPTLQEKHAQTLYRADIDGLRTIAIIIVVIFHAFPQFMPGGFIGVDVFFVISGYLISGIIIKQSKKGKFSYTDFYSRRIKRIYPTLIVVLLFVLWLADKVYQQKQLKSTLKTMAASTIFGANIQILTYQKGYFDPEVKDNPLLHLWSLGVQEQFYIVWPFFISLILLKFRKKATLLLSAFTLASLVLSLIVVYYNQKFAFYFPVCRFWQMSIGGLISYQDRKFNNTMINHLMSIGGTLAILTTIWLINERSLFPGWWALIPTLGSGLILQAAPDALINKHILSTSLFVFIGKISYPLYLWHWPLLVFGSYMYPQEARQFLPTNIASCILTYCYVENKIRFRKQKIIIIILTACMLIIGLTCLFAINTERQFVTFEILQQQINDNDSKFIRYLKEYQKALIPGPDDFYVKNGKKLPNSSKNPNRQHPTVQKIKAVRKYMEWDEAGSHMFLQQKVNQTSKYFYDNGPKLTVFEVANEGKQNQVFIVGDSHAKFLLWRFQYLYQQSMSQNKTYEFPTILGIIRQNSTYLLQASEFANLSQTFIKKHLPKRLLFAHRWLGYWKHCMYCPSGTTSFSPEFYEMIKSHSQEYAEMMKQLINLGIQVYVVTIHLDDQLLNPQNMLDANGIIQNNIVPIKLSDFRTKYRKLIEIFEPALQNVGVKLVHLSDNHCWEDTCHKLTPSGHTFFIDDNHYGKVYSRYWASSVDFLVDF